MAMAVWALGPLGFRPYIVEGDSLRPTQATPTHTLTPGFVDIHIHGAFGIDFMSADQEAVRIWSNKLGEIGYEAFLPTTVTGSVEEIQRALAALPEDDPRIAGFHLEGPFLSPKHPGAQPPHAIVEPPVGPSEWDAILDDPRLKVITLAGEQPGALDLIRRLKARGVRVSLGHTDATFAQAKAAFEAGATNTTHTFNAMRGLHHREAGMVGFALQEDRLKAELIYDRIHVSRDAARLLVKLKGPDRLIAVSDATMAAGLPAGQNLTMWGLDCVIGDKEIRLASNGALAGSAITLKDAFQNLASDFGPELAIWACCINPRVALGGMEQPKVWLLWNEQWDLLEVRSAVSAGA